MTRAIASQYPAGRRACAWCGTVKTFRRGVRYCGHRCAARGRTIALGDVALHAIAVHASQAAAQQRHAAVLEKVAGMDAVTAYRYGYKLGQAAGYNSASYRAKRDARRVA